MKLFKNTTKMLLTIVVTSSLLDAQKPHTPAYDQPDPFAKNTVSPVRQLSGIQSAELTGTPEQMARLFLSQNIDVFQMRPSLDDVVLEKIQESPAGYHVRFYQTYDGIQIYRSEIVVSINHSNKASFYMSDYRPDITLSTTTPGISSETAISLAKSALNPQSTIYAQPQVNLLVLPLTGGDKLGYRVMLPSLDPLGDWEIFVDAETGLIIWIHDLTEYYDGSGKVFDPDPLTTAQHYYGSDGFEDNGDQDHTALNNQRITLTLQDIEYSVPTYYLNGPYITILDFEAPTVPPVTSNDGNFYYTRSQSGFEDVMVYYNIDKIQRYLQSMGFINIQNNTIEADPHGLNGADNSHYLPGTNRLAFGEGGVDDAEDADVIWHEYGHAIQHDQITGSFEYELRAMGEGFGDYWAGSYSALISSWESDFVFTWDAGITPSGYGAIWDGRRLDEDKHYPEDLVGQVHDDGEIWSAALWDIHNVLGRAVTDKLVVQSHYYLNGSANMIEGSNAIIQADWDIPEYNGVHVDQLEQIFCDRGFVVEIILSQNENWVGSVYLNEVVQIPDGITLTISPGTIINFASCTGIKISNMGKLEILGTAYEPVIFTGAGKDEYWVYDYEYGYNNGDYDPYNASALVTLIVDESFSPFDPNIEISHTTFRQTECVIKLLDGDGELGNYNHNRVVIDTAKIEEVNVGIILGFIGKASFNDIKISNSNIGLYLLPSLGNYEASRLVITNNDCGITDLPDEGDYYDIIPTFDLINCTFYNNQDYDIFLRHCPTIYPDPTCFYTDYFIKNSIFALGGGFFDYVYADYSLFYSPPENNPPMLGTGNIIDDDPLLVDPENGDYHLSSGSPCIDAGDPFICDPDSTRADMGAFYFHQDEGGETCDESPYISMNSSKEKTIVSGISIQKKWYYFCIVFGLFLCVAVIVPGKVIKKIKRLFPALFCIGILTHGLLSAEPVDPIIEADYLIITHTELDQGTWLTYLVALQEGRGFQVGVQYVQDGVTTSDDIKSWIYDAYITGVPIEYVLLAGGGADYILDPTPLPEEIKVDPRYQPNIVALADSMNFIPFCYEDSVEVWGPDTINIPTDDPYIGWPDAPMNVAIGRVPAISYTEMQILVDKLVETYCLLTQYEEWKNREIMVSQNVTHSGSGCIGQKVDWMYDEILVYVPSEVDTVFLRSSELDPDCAWPFMLCGTNSIILESAFEDSINNGAALLHFFGTGANPSDLGNFYYAQGHSYASEFNFTNAGKYPYFFGVSCNLGNIQEPFTRPSVMQDLMFVENGGILGAFAPTILTTQWANREFSEDFHRLLNVESVNVIGELTKQTKQEFEPRMPARVWVSRGFILYGDPSMPLSLFQYKDTDITENTTWQGSIVVKNKITVEAGNTLTIKPGTGVFFENNARLMVYGNIEIRGTETFPIVFAAATETPAPDFWKGVIIADPVSSIHIEHAIFRDAWKGLIVHDAPYGGIIENCKFENNKTGLEIQYTPSSLTIRNNVIQNNEVYGLNLKTSSSYISDNNIINNGDAGIMTLLSSNPFIIRNDIGYNGTGASWLYSGIKTLFSSPKLYLGFDPEIPNCQTNNWIHDNGYSGVSVWYNSNPNLGVYNATESNPPQVMPYGGFNRFYGNVVSIYNSEESENTVYAQVNYWDWEGDPCTQYEPTNIVGDVIWDPVAPIIGINTQPQNQQIVRALEKEMSGNYVDATATYDSVISQNPDDPVTQVAISGIVRCYESLNDEESLIPKLDQISANYSGNLAEISSKDHSIPYLTKQESFAEALDLCEELLGYYAGTDQEALYIYESAWIIEQMTEAGLLKSSLSYESKYREVMTRFPDSPLAQLAALELGDDYSPPVISPITIPDTYSLSQSYPNPFNPKTTIRYDLPENGWVTLKVYNILGKEVRTLVDMTHTAGYKQVVWDGKDGFEIPVGSGVYIYRLTARSVESGKWFHQTRKVLLLR